MAMRMTGGRGRVASEINMTPMIDVLLVLLVIFMVVRLGIEQQQGVSVQVPPPEPAATPSVTDDVIVLEVEGGGRLFLNRQPVAAPALQATLARVYAGRPRKVLFVKGAEAVRYGEVMAAVDAGRAAGVVAVVLVPRAAPH